MKKFVKLYLSIMIFSVLFACITVNAETEYNGTHKFTNTLEMSVKLYFANDGDSDVVIYNAQNEVTGFIPYEKAGANTVVDIPASSYCIINNLNTVITLPEGVVAEVSDKEKLIERHSLIADSGKAYVIRNSLETTVKFGAFSATTGNCIQYKADGSVNGYELSFRLQNNDKNELKAKEARCLEGIDAEIYYPTDGGIVFTELENGSIIKKYEFVPEKIYRIKNNSDKTLSYRLTTSVTAQKVTFNVDGSVTGYSRAENTYAHNYADLKAGEAVDVKGYDTTVYCPAEFDISIEESAKTELFKEYKMSSEKIYKIKNNHDKALSYRTATAGTGERIIYNSDGTLRGYSVNDTIYPTHAVELRAGEASEFEGYDMEIYYPIEFDITFEESSKTDLFKKYNFNKSHSYLISNTTQNDYNLLFFQSFTADVLTYSNGKLSDFVPAQSTNRYFTIFKNRTYLLSECEAEVYMLAQLINSGEITITEQDYCDTIIEYEVAAEKVYEIKNSGDADVSIKSTGLNTMSRIIYNGNGEMEEYSLSKGSNNRDMVIKAGYRLLMENASGTIFVPVDYANVVSVTEKETRLFTQIAIPADEAVKIENSSDKGLSVLVNNQNYSLITFSSPTQKQYIASSNRNYEIYKNKYVLLKNISGEVLTLYIPAELVNRFVKYNYVTAKNFDDETKGYYASVKIRKSLSVPQNVEKQIQTDFLSSYNIKAYNNTQSKDITLQKNLEGVYLNSADVSAGDQLTFTLTSGSTKECTVTAILDDKCHADLIFETVELPGITVYHGNTLTDSSYIILLYNNEGVCIRKDRLYSGLLPHIQEGKYTAVVMKKAGDYPYLPNLGDYEASALEEGIHYVKSELELTAGIMEVVHFTHIPNVSDTDLSYFAYNSPVFEVYHTSSQVSDTAKFSFAYETKPGIAEMLDKVAVSFYMEEDMIIYTNSIRVNGETATYSEYNRRYTINAPADKGTIEFYVKFLRNGTYSISPSVDFRGKSISKTEKVKTLEFANQLVTIYAQTTSPTSTLRVVGTSVAEKEVGIYCNGVLLGEAVAEKNGAYELQITLPDVYTGKVYKLYAMCDNIASKEIEVTYLPTKPTLKVLNLKVYTNGHPTTIDLLSESVYSYVFPFSWAFCYEAEFEGVAVEEAYILNNNGKYLKMYYDSSINKFTTQPLDKSKFVMADTVTYIYKNPADTYKTTAREDREQSLPPVLKYSKKTVTDMSLSSIPQDLMEAYDGLATPEHYLRLTLESLPEAGEDLQIAFDVVLFKDGAHINGTKYDRDNNSYINPKGALYLDPFMKSLLGNDYNATQNRNIKSRQMQNHYNLNFAPGTGVYSGNGDMPVGKPIADMQNDGRYDDMRDNMDFVEDNYGGNPLPGEEWNKFKDGIAGMGGDAASLAYGIHGGFSDYNDTKELCDRVMGLLNSVCEAEDEGKSIYQMFDEAFLVPKFFTFDPSGYIYEGYEENRLQGVTVTAYYDENGEKVQWNAKEAGQNNPLKTDEYGTYAWDVPEGTWSVKYEKNGYETAWREGMVVPPPHTNVNVGLVSTSGSKIESFKASDEGIVVTFTKPVFAEDIKKEYISFTQDGVDCAAEVVPETEHESEFGILSKSVLIKCNTPLISGGVYRITVSDSVRTYNGISARDAKDYTHKPVKLIVQAKDINLNKADSISFDITLEGEAVSESVISVTAEGNQVAEYWVSQTEETGKYILSVKGISVGTAVLDIGVEGTSIKQSVMVNVYPENYDFTVDRKLIYNSYDKILTVFSPTILGECTVLCCEYDEHSRFESVEILEHIKLNSTENTVDLTEAVRGDEHKIKFMVIRSLNDFYPLIEALEY